MSEEPQKYENSVGRLRDIVGMLEKGDLGLEETLTLFNEATNLVSSCEKQLSAAEEQMQILIKSLSDKSEQ